jgi:hypothetical protein
MLLLLPLLAGCQAPPPEPPKSEVENIDYKGWASLTRKPIPVAASGWRYCRAPGPDSDYAKESKKYGPHFSPAIRVLANPAAAAHLRSREADPLPEGAVIVKEKLFTEKDTEPVAYAAMVKREAGYDPEGGDWEYVYVTSGEGGKVERGRIETCAACHVQRQASDYLFRDWEKTAAGQ